MANVKQMENIVPLITREVALCQYVCKLMLGVDIFDLNLGVQIDSVKQPAKSNSVSSGHVSHCWTFALDDHLDHCSVILKNVKHRTKLTILRIR